METDITYFFGRFHPLVVHLPIGFVLFGLVLEIISRLFKKDAPEWGQATAFAYLCGGLTGLMAVITGWILAREGGHADHSVDWHRWMGIAVTGLAFVSWFMKSGKWNFSVRTYYMNLGILILALLITGHLGGKLTHGPDYLTEHAPRFIKGWMGNEERGSQADLPANPDSVVVFTHLVKPILASKCMSCHDSDQRKGGLDLTTDSSILSGGDELPAVVSGKPMESGVIQRVTLPHGHTKYMPPNGRPLDFNEIRLLEWWIRTGASFTGHLSDQTVPEDISRILLDDYGLDTRQKPFFETVPTDPLPQSVLDGISNSGFEVGVLAEGNHYLRVKAGKPGFSDEDWQRLLGAKEHMVILDLARTAVNDSAMVWVGQLSNLYRLDLNNTRITDRGLGNLVSLEKLEILNLYGTDITDKGINLLKTLPALKKVYLWGTDVTDTAVDTWREENDEIEVVFNK